MREELAEHHAVGLPEVARRFESTDGTLRYLLRLEDGRTVGRGYLELTGYAGPVPGTLSG